MPSGILSQKTRNCEFCIFFMFCLLVFNSQVFGQQTNNQSNEVATQTEALSKVANTNNQAKAKSMSSNSSTSSAQSSGYTQNDDTAQLDSAIGIYNDKYCPPEKTITEINPSTLKRLVGKELIKRVDLDKYGDMVMVNGKVYVKKETVPEENPEPQNPQRPEVPNSRKDFFGSFNYACEELSDGKFRGKSRGNQKPKNYIKLRAARMSFRDRLNSIRQLEYFVPLINLSSPFQIRGKSKSGPIDFATSLMLRKTRVAPGTKFDDMPSLQKMDPIASYTQQNQN